MAEIAIEYSLIGVAVVLVPLGLVLAGRGLRRRRHGMLAVAVVCLLLSGFLWWRTSHAEFWIVDSCLDAGGRYDHQAQTCEFE